MGFYHLGSSIGSLPRLHQVSQKSLQISLLLQFFMLIIFSIDMRVLWRIVWDKDLPQLWWKMAIFWFSWINTFEGLHSAANIFYQNPETNHTQKCCPSLTELVQVGPIKFFNGSYRVPWATRENSSVYQYQKRAFASEIVARKKCEKRIFLIKGCFFHQIIPERMINQPSILNKERNVDSQNAAEIKRHQNLIPCLTFDGYFDASTLSIRGLNTEWSIHRKIALWPLHFVLRSVIDFITRQCPGDCWKTSI